jgi:hypothetical protein
MTYHSHALRGRKTGVGAQRPMTLADVDQLIGDLFSALKLRAANRGLRPSTKEWRSYVFGTCDRERKKLLRKYPNLDPSPALKTPRRD